MSMQIRGSGGGGKDGSGSAGIAEDPDTLSTVATARFLDLICEGPIQGFHQQPNSDYSIYLDGVPLKDSMGSINFRPYQYQTTLGTANQGVLEGFSSVQQENNVSLKIAQSMGLVIRSVPDVGADSVRITLSVNGLSSTDSSTGRISGTSVKYEVWARVSGGTWRLSLANTITEKTRSKAQVQHEVVLVDLGGGPYEVAVKRITADSASSLLVNDLYWDSYTVINYEKLNYPYSVLCGVNIDARYFSSIPTRAYHIKGLLVKVPANCIDLTTGEYLRKPRTTGTGTTNGVWDGTFSSPVWTDNPVWCLYDLLTNERYGLGKRIYGEGRLDSVNGTTFPTSINKWAFYTAAQYCDEMVYVGDGSGTVGYSKTSAVSSQGVALASIPRENLEYEPRFTLNCYINTAAEAYSVINQICSVFRGMAYWSAGTVTLSQDAPGTPQMVFSQANVINGLFTYEGSSRAERHTAVTVAWNDPSADFVQKFEYIEDRAAILRYGYRPVEVTAFACTSRNQARRMGRSILLTERLDRGMIQFKTGLDAANLQPGAVVSIQDDDQAGVRWAGRVTGQITNYVKSSDLVGTANWFYSPGITVSTGNYTNPIGGPTCSVISEAAVTATHYVEILSASHVVNKTYVFSGYFKASTFARVQLGFATNHFTLTDYANFNLSSGLVTAQGQTCKATIESVGNGWYRCSVTSDAIASGTGLSCFAALITTDTEARVVGTRLGVATNNVLGWGFQLEQASTLGAYIATGTGYKTRVAFDAPVTIPTSGSYNVSLLNSSGTLETRAVTLTAGAAPYADVDSYTNLPRIGQVWSIDSTAVTARPARVVSIREETPSQYTVTCVESNQQKYSAIDVGTQVEEGNYSFLSVGAPPNITGLTSVEVAYKPTVSSPVRSDVLVSWDKITDHSVRGYLVMATSGADTYRYPESLEPKLTLDNLPSGTYQVSVQAINYFGVKGSQSTIVQTVTNIDVTPPSSVTGFTSAIDSVTGVKLSWNNVADFIDFYEVRAGSTWATGTLVARVSSTVLQVGSLAAANYTFWIAAVDTSGNYSNTPTSVAVSLSAPNAPSVSGSIVNTDEVITWTAPSSQITIDHYEIRYGSTWADGTLVDSTKSLTLRRPITYSGSRTYWVAAVDVVGNVGAAASRTITATVPTAPTLTSVLSGELLKLSWTTPSAVLPIDHYEVRYGASFAAGTLVFSGSALSFEFTVNHSGSRTFWVAAIDQAGGVGVASSYQLDVIAPGVVTSTRAEVVDNNALLYWSAPTTGTLPISRYEVRKGVSWAAGTVVGSNGTSTFTTIFEQQGGIVNYWVAAYDSAGNAGTPSALVVAVQAPPDYVLFNDWNSTWGGTETNVVQVGTQLFGPVNAAQTWEQHFGGGLLSSPDDLTTWTATNATITANAGNDAGGFAVADRVNRTAIGDHYLQRTYTTTTHASKTFTFSCYLQLGTLTGNVVLTICDGAGTVVGTATVTPTTSVARYSVSATFGAAPAANIILRIDPANDAGTAGDTFFVSNCQLVEGASAQPFWRTITDQVTAGYPLYLEPGLTTGSYQEIIDYGSDLASTLVTATLSTTAIAGTVTVTVQMDYKKSADVTWTSMPANASQYLAAGGLRYLRITYTLTAAGGANVISLNSLNVKLNVKLKSDSLRSATVLGGAHLQNNLSSYRGWVAGTTLPTAAGWQNSTSLTGENVLAVDTGPGGVSQLVLKATQVTPSAGSWDGGFVTPGLVSDITSAYMFAVFVNRQTVNGLLYVGLGDNSGSSANNKYQTLAGAADANPYNFSGLTSPLGTNGNWYMLVGLVHESGYAGGQTTISGIYDMTGARVGSATRDYRFDPANVLVRFRAGFYGNATDTSGTVTGKFCRPMLVKTTTAAAPALIQKMIKDATTYGKEVIFGTQFVDVQAMAVTPMGTTPSTPVVDFVDQPYPTSCNVYLFDSAGNRVAQDFSILTRGV